MKMKTPQKEILVSLVIATLSSFCVTVLRGQETNDITTRREFGCRWYGGSSSTISCRCLEDVEMLIEKNNIPSYSTAGIEISGCKSVRFGKKSITDISSLRTINLANIGSIIFDEESINWYGYRDSGSQYEERFDLTVPSLKISIYNSTVSLISSHTFKGRINEITFDNVLIKKMLPFAFTNLLQTEKISIKNSVLKSMDRSFKKFGTEYLELDGVIADTIPSRTFSNITVYQKVLINNCSINTVRSGAFSINNPEIFEVTNNKIGQLNGEAFKVISKGTVLFKDNIFNKVDDGAFQGITFRRDGVLNNIGLTFNSNTFSTLTRDSLSLSIPNINVKFINIYINETCDCRSIDHKIKESIYYTDIKCLYNEEYMVVKSYKSNMCSIMSNYYITIILVSIVLALLLIVVCGLILYYKLVYRSKKYGSQKQSQNGNLSLIVPDGRTYRETELHVIVEKTDLLTTDL